MVYQSLESPEKCSKVSDYRNVTRLSPRLETVGTRLASGQWYNSRPKHFFSTPASLQMNSPKVVIFLQTPLEINSESMSTILIVRFIQATHAHLQFSEQKQQSCLANLSLHLL